MIKGWSARKPAGLSLIVVYLIQFSSLFREVNQHKTFLDALCTKQTCEIQVQLFKVHSNICFEYNVIPSNYIHKILKC